MYNLVVKYNDDNNQLYCTYCKELIHIGEKYAVVEEQIYGGETIEKPYKLEYCPTVEDDEEPYIPSEEE